jgi:hypothetical protein
VTTVLLTGANLRVLGFTAISRPTQHRIACIAGGPRSSIAEAYRHRATAAGVTGASGGSGTGWPKARHRRPPMRQDGLGPPSTPPWPSTHHGPPYARRRQPNDPAQAQVGRRRCARMRLLDRVGRRAGLRLVLSAHQRRPASRPRLPVEGRFGGFDDYAVIEGTLIGRIYRERVPGGETKWRWFLQSGNCADHHSASRARTIAGLSGFFTLIQSRQRPDR